MNDQITKDVDKVWRYMQMNQQVGSAECLMVLGSRDDRVAQYAAELLSRYEFGMAIVSRGVAHGHDLLKTSWEKGTEAEHFAAVMRRSGCQAEVLLEKEAQNTGQNAVLSYQLIKSRGLSLQRSILIVTKPYMERRALATFEAQWPDETATFRVTSPHSDFDSYINEDQTCDDVVNIMIGDLERIIKYPQLGFQSKQVVPQVVYDAMKRLIAAGYAKHSLK